MKTGMKLLTVAALTTGAMFASVSANAATTVVLDDITAKWQNTVGGTHVVEGSGDPATLSWGSGGTSSYKFNSTDPNVTFTLPPSPTASKSLGTLTHYNQPINTGTSITKTQLKLTTEIKVNNNYLGDYDFVFDIFHNETANTWSLFGNCCDDIVTFGQASQSQSFSFGGTNYTLYLTGFGTKSTNIKSSFYSEEGGNNQVQLWGYIGTAPAVPEPSTWAMMIGGLGLVGVAMRRRKSTVSFA